MPKIISHKPRQNPVGQELNTKNQEPGTKNFSFLLTCQSGLESLVKRECERLRLEDIRAQDRLVECSGNEKNMYELLTWSRFANRVYLNLTPPFEGGKSEAKGSSELPPFEGGIKGGSVSETKPLRPSGTSPSQGSKITDFDTLFTMLEGIEWGQYLTGKEKIVIEASSTRSELSSIPTIQSVAQKAIFSTLYTPDNTSGSEVHILILIIDNIAHILLDITGSPLHKRGYREEAGEAPIKENLAAALVAFANWKYSTPLSDPFCGSGTIAIEAVMIARNIAPGLYRHFRIEELPLYNRALLSEVKEQAKAKIYPSGKYQVLASDVDAEMVAMARRNAERAGVSEDITFSVSDFLEEKGGMEARGNSPLSKGDVTQGQGDLVSGKIPPTPFIKGERNQSSIIITNPPYGNRLQGVDLERIYQKLSREVRQNGGGFITSYHLNDIKDFANKKLLNGSEECRFWYKRG